VETADVGLEGSEVSEAEAAEVLQDQPFAQPDPFERLSEEVAVGREAELDVPAERFQPLEAVPRPPDHRAVAARSAPMRTRFCPRSGRAE